MKSVLILCTGNSCRSQMAEALWNHLGGSDWKVESAGSSPSGYVHPLAIAAMEELKIGLEGYRSKSLSEFDPASFDLIVTVCGNAKDSCPNVNSAAKTLHWPFDDPADAEGSDAEQMNTFRRVRDEIQSRIREYLNSESS